MDQGFNIHGKFYPLVGYEDWLNRDYVLASALTRLTTEQIFEDAVMLEQALVAVAFQHANPDAKLEDVCRYIGSLKPAEIEDVGFVPEPDAIPLDETVSNGNGARSSLSSDPPLVPSPE